MRIGNAGEHDTNLSLIGFLFDVMVSVGRRRRLDLGCFVARPVSEQLLDTLGCLLRVDVAGYADDGLLRREVFGVKCGG